MKNILSICLICIITFSCKKDAPVIYNDGIFGKWVLSEYYVNPGVGASEWQTPDDSFVHTLEFKSNGDLLPVQVYIMTLLPMKYPIAAPLNF
ncbi:hypothetical protein BH10BAC2_BH10BAC2_21380 [soil metagenome]